MQHFFVTPVQVDNEHIIIEGSDVNHIKNVLRMKLGEELEISDGNNKKYRCEIERFEEQMIIVKILEHHVADSELPSKIYLFQGLPKNDKMELIVQKAVELGAYQIIPVATKRAVVKLDEKKAIKKVERWNAIAEGGAKQSGRSLIPEVMHVMSFKEAIQYAVSQEIKVTLIPYELAEGMQETKTIISQICPGQSVGIFIGPEGGFEKEEVAYALSNNVKPITLGKRILRTETAGLATLAILMYQLEM
ncbi:MAG: 16S rRNA (uracil(1498)-N(3))-methyltransferase [Lachnospiraceae bacterium]|nr:16S rRNA (uracil(1498)-N(3))-methyltransferase [Lachnospiraceae bacterium]